MKAAWRWLRQFWWVVIATCLALLWLLSKLVYKRSHQNLDGPEDEPLPSFLSRAKDNVERIKLEGEVARARAVAKAEHQQEELRSIERVAQNDPKEARKRMADWLARNL